MLNRIKIESMNNTRANYEVFKESFLKTTKDYSFYDEIRENSSECAWIKEDRDFVKSTMKGDLAKTLWLSYNNNNDSHDEINMYYSSLLDKTKRLALELGLTNSLEISNLFSYLLCNGYFSKTKSNICDSKESKGMYGLLYADIIDGKSFQVCNTEMLKDLLNSCDFAATNLFNTISKSSKIDVDYRLPLEKQTTPLSTGQKVKSFLLSPITKRTGNYSFVLIRENDKIYIYDPTKLSLFEVTDSFNANLINGNGTTKLHPYMSFLYLKDITKEMIALDGLFEISNLSSPYNREDFIITSEANIETFKKNIDLLDDFYADSFEERRKISKISDRLVKTRRKK